MNLLPRQDAPLCRGSRKGCPEEAAPGKAKCRAHLAQDARNQARRRKRLGLTDPHCDHCGADDHGTAGCPERVAAEEAARTVRLRVVEDPWPHLPDGDLPQRPQTRADCEAGPRPCPWVSCRHHLADLMFVDGRHPLKLRDADEAAQMILDQVETCALDLADDGVQTLERIGEAVGVGRERVRQIEAEALPKMRRRAKRLMEDQMDTTTNGAPPAPAPAAQSKSCAMTAEQRAEIGARLAAARAAKRGPKPLDETPAEQDDGKRGRQWTDEEKQAQSERLRAKHAARRAARAAELGEAPPADQPAHGEEQPAESSQPGPGAALSTIAQLAEQARAVPQVALEVYIGPPRGDRVAQLERCLEWVRGSLQQRLPALEKAGHDPTLRAVRDVLARIEGDLAGG